ncbi:MULTISPECIES: COR domain-containing protein [Pseudanabaena]|uniref:non-specific serine/threonine protein kinase n=2 Tax=Pseudanabaena TaxID=1152 RepID=L8MYP4_9CYAN|nr:MULTISPECIES: COR domain-containing protein [Pseudanabaena]ELS31914.1 small GTP-binding protein [Pseudanabaena biceps PCC 7429]MDG3495828.1 COR domain-containing protein [Pseudanabaena catenata USMAC16]
MSQKFKVNRLTAIPQEIFQLTNLKELHIPFNQITQIPDSICNLANLTLLDLSSNQITQIPDVICNLVNLTQLYFGCNQITQIPDAIANLANLTLLHLSNNHISNITDKLFKLSKLQKLNLSLNKISTIPEEISQLYNLEEIHLNSNRINIIPDTIGDLYNLQVLNLAYNKQICTIPDTISKLFNLVTIYLEGNQIATIPHGISQLSKLQTLMLNENQISIIPNEISNLSNLQELSLYKNQIRLIPDSITKLSNLNELYLSRNQISMIPDSLSDMTKLKALGLRDNPLPIPEEILNNYHNPTAIFDFWLERERQPLNEAKMILVGQGTVGKTSLVKRLLDNQFDAGERKTDGINIRDWQISANNEQVKLRVWDFGGQEIMHATHQFFLTERSLYLLVINTREDELANRIEYWLKLIESLGNQAPVIIIGNKIDDHPLDLDRHGLQTKYPNIKGFIGTSCATGLGISELKQKITEIIANEMPHVFDPIPVKWLNLKDKLEQDDRDYITYQEYEQKCIDTGITRESSRHTLVRLLHELGIILNFTDDKRLKDTNVLNPEWVTVGAYKIINDNLLMTAHQGVLHWQDTERIFQPKSRKEQDCYASEKARKFILRMMEKFELCFAMENSRDRDYPKYLIPDLLPKEEPHTGTWDDCLRFEYRYDKVLPNSVISRFIVKAHKLIAHTNSRTYWRTGVILASDTGNFAYIKADLEDAKIFIRISGTSHTRHSFLSVIRDKFDDIHDCPKLTPDERIGLPDNPQGTASYKHLLKLLERGEITCFPEEADHSYNIRELIEGIEDRRSRSKDDLRERESYSDRLSQPIVNVNIHNINQQATIMPELEKPQPKNTPKSTDFQIPSVITASMSFVFIVLTTASLVLTFAGILKLEQFIIAMFSIILVIVIGVVFVLKVTGQMEGKSFEKVIMAVIKQLTLYDALLSKIGDIIGKSKK